MERFKLRDTDPKHFAELRLQVKLEHIKKLKAPTWEIQDAINFAFSHDLEIDENIFNNL